MTTQTTNTTIVTLRTRAFQGALETNKHQVDEDGTVAVYDSVAHHYTRCHSLSPRDLGRVRAAACKA